MTTPLAGRLLQSLPDEPRWLETRAMLQHPAGRASGGPDAADGFAVRVVHGALSAVSVVGRPESVAIIKAIDQVTSMTPVIAQVDNADHVQRCLGEGWRGERALLHCPAGTLALPSSTSRPAGQLQVRLLAEADSLDHVPPGLRHELTHARLIAPVAAVFVNGLPASFCYPCWVTESLWDVSIDTLEGFRGQSLARSAVAFMVEHMRRDRREPVWGALESNTASRRLAEKLGFVPVDTLVVFSRGPWAFLTAGFKIEPS
jgi:GNAT superfamily N-acetyltransferase